MPDLDESQLAAAKSWVTLALVANSAPILLHIIAIIAFWAGWVRPKSAMSFVTAGYIVSQYTVMVARCAICRIEGTGQPKWFSAIAFSRCLAVMCLALWMV